MEIKRREQLIPSDSSKKIMEEKTRLLSWLSPKLPNECRSFCPHCSNAHVLCPNKPVSKCSSFYHPSSSLFILLVSLPKVEVIILAGVHAAGS